MKKTIIIFVSIFLISGCTQETKVKESNPFEALGDIAYTLDGEKTTESYEILMANNEVNKIICEKGTEAIWNNTNKTLKLKNLNIPDYCTIDFKSKPKVTLYEQILADHPIVLTRSSFDEVPGETEITKTIYKEETKIETGGDNNKVVYYFYGNTTDNWVKFAGFYWRIIRTNEDGSVRLLYAGISPDTTEGYITSTRNDGITGTTTWYGPGDGNNNSNDYNNTRYVGYMYGDEGSLSNNRGNVTSSGVKTFVDNWYRDNINSSYGSYVSETAIYCNDRSGDGYETSGIMHYAVYKRLIDSKSPSFKCGNNPSGTLYGDANTADKFSKSTTNGGNGMLTYPVALMTADEVAYAGGLWVNSSPNTYYYLNSIGESAIKDKLWWTMSSSYFDYGTAAISVVNGVGGYLGDIFIASLNTVRPVLSLKSCVTVKEETRGTSDNPYEVEIDKSCIDAEN